MKTASTVHPLVAFGLGAAVWAGASAIGTAQTSPARPPETIVVIGCVTQPTGRENATVGDPTLSRLEITDTRSNPPRRFIVQGSKENLAWHVGHTLEVHGQIATGESRGAAGRDGQLPVINVQQVVYLQPTCVVQPK